MKTSSIPAAPRFLHAGALLLAMALGIVPARAAAFHLSADFSLASNPNGAWTYGYATNLGAIVPFTRSRHSDGFDIWETPQSIPAAFRNTASSAFTNGSGGVVPAGGVVFHPGTEGTGRNFGVLRLTIPAGESGTYRIETAVRPVYPGPPQGDSDFHVLRSGVELFSQFLTPSQSTAFTNVLTLNGGDTIDFAVGRGADGHESGSVLNIFAKVSLASTSPPSITSPPANRTVTVGDTASFSVGATGWAPLSFQWLFQGQEIPGENQSSLMLPNVQFSQAGSYTVVVTNVAGSVTSSVAMLAVNPAPVAVGIVSVGGLPGREVFVPVEMIATGNENAVGFSLNFDTNHMIFGGAVLGAGAPAGASLLVNSVTASAGKVGLAVALEPGATLGVGTQEVVVVRFEVASVSSPVVIPLTFGDQPTARQLADSQAQVLPAVFNGGTVTLSSSLVRLVGTTTVSGGEATVRVQLVAQGHENAMGFSLNFNSAVLGFTSATRGESVPVGGTFIVNETAAANGRVGIAVAMAAGNTFAPGTQELAVIQFTVAPVLSAISVPVTFGDQPTARQLSDGQARALPGLFTGGDVAIVEVQFEGDVSPRPGGDGALTIIDLVQTGRFVAALDTLSSPSEYQRVDCAPRASRGNGAVTVSDLVQAGRYTVGLDPLTPVGGPTADTEGGGGGGFLPAAASSLTVVSTMIALGRTNDVPIHLNACGEENALSFSLSYDATNLTFQGVLSGSGAMGAGLTINSNQMASGRVGVVLALSPGQKFTAGLRELVRVRFVANPTNVATTTLAFTSQPVARETSDVSAGTLATTYNGGTVSVTPLPGPPLQWTLENGSIFITWSTSPAGFVLESSSETTGGTWTPVPGVVNLGPQKLAVVQPDAPRKFFRLKKP